MTNYPRQRFVVACFSTRVLGWRISTLFGNVKTGKKLILVFDSNENQS